MLAFYRKYALPIQLVLLIGIVVALAANGIYPSTKLGFALVVLWGVLNARVRAFVIDFAPFIVLLLSYSALRSFADNLSSSEIHIRDMIAWEKSLFGGTLPGYFLQKHLIGGTLTPVLDVLTNSLYLSHFITPVIAAGLL